ncbi:PQQ-dependent catabolism-associated CXXCW motif protein [Salipiger mucosus]|uniref:Rhodanese domain-containing protein n=1 Tax=Salipiger mucosus DSM 16094 TaxID=1123237 RepID=S9Q803_9RHOB|nr:PQQ-dependent catabolism-associated CXXCW motif protein [Salipiger mucosus]EPX76112.1 hypothetical protein Salmuc_00765 [Salipiger mucosus DSM 16094]
MTRLLAALLLLPAALSAGVPEPEGYRDDHYRGPVPATLEGATVVGPEQAFELWSDDAAAFVDVLPRAPKPANLPEGTIWREKARHSIPGALWLPNVGYGALAKETETYFREGLAAASGSDKARPLVFFCLEECWMSWNAAKRALTYGYAEVYWLPEGTDGWTLWDYPTEEVTPWQP